MERDIGFPLTLAREDFFLLKINFKNFEHIEVHAMTKMVKIGAGVLTVPMSPSELGPKYRMRHFR